VHDKLELVPNFSNVHVKVDISCREFVINSDKSRREQREILQSFTIGQYFIITFHKSFNKCVIKYSQSRRISPGSWPIKTGGSINKTLFQGAATGVIAGHVVTLWITFGRLTIEKPPTPHLPLSTDGCTNTSFNDHILKPEHQTSFWTVTTTTPAPINYTGNFSYDIINTTRAAPSYV
jgi:hypothetical protein